METGKDSRGSGTLVVCQRKNMDRTVHTWGEDLSTSFPPKFSHFFRFIFKFIYPGLTLSCMNCDNLSQDFFPVFLLLMA